MIVIDPEKMAPGLNQIVQNEGTHHPGVAYICSYDDSPLKFL